ncbi:MAG: hypothetical protein ACE5DQ_02525, partial [Candidatus Paceibacterota bacterium]
MPEPGETLPSIPERKKIAVVDVSKIAEAHSRDTAEGKLTASEKETKGFRGFVKKVFKYNYFREWIRQKEIVKAEKKIKDEDNIFANEECSREVHDRAMQAEQDRFLSDYDEAIHSEAGEKRITLEDDNPQHQAIKKELVDLINRYLDGTCSDEESFLTARQALLEEIRKRNKELFDRGLIYSDGLLVAAKEFKSAGSHDLGIDDVDIVLGVATDT